MREEDFASAAQYKAEAEQLEARLPANKLLLCTLLARLEGGAGGGGSSGSSASSGSLQDKQSVVQQLGDLGDMYAAPALAACLHEVEEGLAAAAEDSLWQVFMRSVGGCHLDCFFGRDWLFVGKQVACRSPSSAAAAIASHHLHPHPHLPHLACPPAAPAAAPPAGAPPPPWMSRCSRG